MSEPGDIHVQATATSEGGLVEVEIRLLIPPGTHIEAHEPAFPLLIPTVVELEELEVTSVSYPEPVEKTFGLPGPPLLVYEGEVSIRARARAKQALRTARGTVRFQPCVGGACLPPRSKPWQARVEG